MEASNPEAVHCSMVEDGGTGEVSVQLVTLPHEISLKAIEEGPVVAVDPLHVIADRVPEHPSGSGSKSTFKPNKVNHEFVSHLYLSCAFVFVWFSMDLLYCHKKTWNVERSRIIRRAWTTNSRFLFNS